MTARENPLPASVVVCSVHADFTVILRPTYGRHLRGSVFYKRSTMLPLAIQNDTLWEMGNARRIVNEGDRKYGIYPGKSQPVNLNVENGL